ncbi:hypothetical protein ACI2OX_19870 [Bacillus sp. N9]
MDIKGRNGCWHHRFRHRLYASRYANVLNLSHGSPASFVDASASEQEFVQNGSDLLVAPNLREWDKAPIFDQPMWEADSYYGLTGGVTSAGKDDYNFLGEDRTTGAIDPQKIAISPNGDGVQDDALMILSFLRNAKKSNSMCSMPIKKTVRTLITESEVKKNYYDSGRAPMYSLSSTRGGW